MFFLPDRPPPPPLLWPPLAPRQGWSLPSRPDKTHTQTHTHTSTHTQVGLGLMTAILCELLYVGRQTSSIAASWSSDLTSRRTMWRGEDSQLPDICGWKKFPLWRLSTTTEQQQIQRLTKTWNTQHVETIQRKQITLHLITLLIM